jgi:hypothetical protein
MRTACALPPGESSAPPNALLARTQQVRTDLARRRQCRNNGRATLSADGEAALPLGTGVEAASHERRDCRSPIMERKPVGVVHGIGRGGVRLKVRDTDAVCDDREVVAGPLLASDGCDPLRLSGIVRRARHLMRALHAARKVDPPDWLIAAGAIRDVVWDELHSQPATAAPRDIDLAFFDPADLSATSEGAIESRLRAWVPDLPWEAEEPSWRGSLVPRTCSGSRWRRSRRVRSQCPRFPRSRPASASDSCPMTTCSWSLRTASTICSAGSAATIRHAFRRRSMSSGSRPRPGARAGQTCNTNMPVASDAGHARVSAEPRW